MIDRPIVAWVSVLDDVPNRDVCVLVHYRDGTIKTDYFSERQDWTPQGLVDAGFWFVDDDANEITHWANLPEPPKGGGQ